MLRRYNHYIHALCLAERVRFEDEERRVRSEHETCPLLTSFKKYQVRAIPSYHHIIITTTTTTIFVVVVVDLSLSLSVAEVLLVFDLLFSACVYCLLKSQKPTPGLLRQTLRPLRRGKPDGCGNRP